MVSRPCCRKGGKENAIVEYRLRQRSEYEHQQRFCDCPPRVWCKRRLGRHPAKPAANPASNSGEEVRRHRKAWRVGGEKSSPPHFFYNQLFQLYKPHFKTSAP